MPYYRVAQICEKGDLITDSADVYPEECQKRCMRCGSKTITACPSCDTPIRGVTDSHPDYAGYRIPLYCHECGEPYPWTSRILESAVHILSLDIELDVETKNIISSAIPELMTDNPLASVAAATYSSYISKASDVTKAALHALLADVASETVKHIIFG